MQAHRGECWCFPPKFNIFSYCKNFRKILTNSLIPAGIYFFKINNGNTRTLCEICSKLTIKTPKQRYWGRSVAFLVNFEQNLGIALLFLWSTLNKYMPAGTNTVHSSFTMTWFFEDLSQSCTCICCQCFH